MPVRAALFDLGDTLIFQSRQPNEHELYAAMAAQVRPLLQSWHVPDALDAVPLVRDLCQAVEAAQPERRERGQEVDGPFVTRGALAEYGIDASEEQALAFWRASAVRLELWGWQLYPDTLDILRRLRALPVATALVSNSYYTVDLRRPLLAEMGLTDDLFDAYVSSADVMRPKPRPEPFLRALGALAVQPQDAIFVGDVFDVDIAGAKELGLTTVWKLNGRHEVPLPPEADFAIHDLWELFTLDLLPQDALRPEDSRTPHPDENPGPY